MLRQRLAHLLESSVSVICSFLVVATTISLAGAAPVAQFPTTQTRAGPSSTRIVATRATTSGGGTAQLGPGATVRAPTTSHPPTPIQPTQPPQRPRASQSAGGDALSPRSAQAPATSETVLPPTYVPPAGLSQPNDLVLSRSTVIGPAVKNQVTSLADEPSVSSNGDDVFYTGNFYAALSTDAGNTFAYVDPYTAFPRVFGGFCCDQRTIYVPGADLTVWTLQYATDSSYSNEVRLAVAKGQNGLASSAWTYWDFTIGSANISVPPPTLAFDYPQIAFSSNNLYLTTNLVDTRGAITYSVIYQCPLSALATLGQGSPLTCAVYWDQVTDGFTPVDGAASTIYWANHLDNHTLRVYSWTDGQPWQSVGPSQVGHSAFPTSIHTCPSPDGLDLCGFDDWTIHGGWVANGVIGFAWDAAQGNGDLGSFPYPYVHAVEIDQSSFALIDEPIIWSSSVAYAYSGVGVNGRGALGVSLAYAGGQYYPGSAVLVRDDISGPTWQPLNVQMGTNGPPGNRWGDFLTARPASGNGYSWLATSFTARGACSDNWRPCSAVQPRFLWFGRQRDNPCQVNCDSWGAHTAPSMMQVHHTYSENFTVTNTGSRAWPASGANPVHLSYHWRDCNGNLLVFDGIRSTLPSDVPLGGAVNVAGGVTTPASPGKYVLQWALVQEGVGWFDAGGAQDLVTPVVVVVGASHLIYLPLVASGGGGNGSTGLLCGLS